MKRFYALPLQPQKVMGKQAMQTCNEQESIAQHIHLMVTSRYGESKYAEDFGNSIWEHEFSNKMHQTQTKEAIKDDLLRCITTFEPRLGDVKVDLSVQQEEVVLSNNRFVRERIRVHISGVRKQEKEPFTHWEQFYIAPMSQ